MYTKNAWEKYNRNNMKDLMKFNDQYIDFLSTCKTERLCVEFALKEAIKRGFVDGNSVKSLKPGDKVYFTNRGKNINLFVIGNRPLEEGLRVLGAHIDSPRLDLKQNPLYEDHDFALLDTHYYGGIKKYQWVTRPLSLVGVICKKDGSIININIGDGPNDPVFGIGDLLIHLSQDQLTLPASKVIEGEKLDVTIGSIPLKGEKTNPVKAQILKLLKSKYKVDEEDLVSAEIEVVPQGRAKSYGLDKSMVAGYGHDDRVCAYTSLRALLDLENVPEFTGVCQLVDKEEIGSVGATGAESAFFENCISEVLNKTGGFDILKLRRCLNNTKMLSSDVSAGFDPLFPQVNEPRNAAYLSKGLCINKYTGRGGKGGANDAAPEFLAEIRKAFDDNNIYFQSGELGKVDVGGGGTIAYIMGDKNMWVVDAGVPVLNMHSPMEIVSKVDVYEAYLGYKVFLNLK